MKPSYLKNKKGILIIYGVIGFLFTFFVKSEADLAKFSNIEWNAKYVLSLCALCVLGFLLFPVFFCFTDKLCKFVKAYVSLKLRKESCKLVSLSQRASLARNAFLISLIINVLSFLPFILAFYPGICAYDLPIQLEQIITGRYNDHHPLFHTLFLKGSLTLTGSVALCTLIQSLLLAVSLSFVIFTMNKLSISVIQQIITELIFAFNLFNGYMAVSLTKDTVFTAFVLLFICSLLLIYKENKFVYSFIYVFSTVGIILFRNNGKYALLVVLLAFFIAPLTDKEKRHFWIKLFIKTALSFAAGLVLLKGISYITNAEAADKREMLSVPIQQLARTMVYEEDKLTEEEASLINEFILYRAYDNYNPVISDPCKGNTNTSVIRYQTGRFVKIYLDLLKKYPGDYINAYLSLIGGYVSPFDESYRIMDVNGETVTRNYIQHTFTATGYEDYVKEESLLPLMKTILDNWAENDGFNVPFFKLFYIPGIYLYGYLIIFALIVERKNYKLLVPLSFIMGYFVTLLLGPTMHLRYIYPVMVTFPLLFTMAMNSESKNALN